MVGDSKEKKKTLSSYSIIMIVILLIIILLFILALIPFITIVSIFYLYFDFRKKKLGIIKRKKKEAEKFDYKQVLEEVKNANN